MIKFVIPIFLLLILYLPLSSYSQNTESGKFPEIKFAGNMTFAGNTTEVIKNKDLVLSPSQFWYFLLLSFIIIIGITIIVAILIKQNIKRNDDHTRKVKFIDIIRDGDYYQAYHVFNFSYGHLLFHSYIFLSI